MSEPTPPERPFDTVSRVTGIKRKDIEEIFKQVKANQAVLDTCKGHDFSVPHRKIGQIVTDWKCSKCGGTVERQCKRWYELGLRHGLSRG